jgi:hypothetical protein
MIPAEIVLRFVVSKSFFSTHFLWLSFEGRYENDDSINKRFHFITDNGRVFTI